MKIDAAVTDYQCVIYPNTGEVFHFAGMKVTMKTSAPAVDSMGSIYELQLPPHYGRIMAHFHRTSTEWFHVLAGTAAFTLNNETVVARTGTYILIPAGVTHTFWNPTAGTTTLLSVRAQIGLQAYLAELTTLTTANETDARQPHAIAVDMAEPMTQLLSLAATYDLFPSDTTMELAITGSGYLV